MPRILSASPIPSRCPAAPKLALISDSTAGPPQKADHLSIRSLFVLRRSNSAFVRPRPGTAHMPRMCRGPPNAAPPRAAPCQRFPMRGTQGSGLMCAPPSGSCPLRVPRTYLLLAGITRIPPWHHFASRSHCALARTGELSPGAVRLSPRDRGRSRCRTLGTESRHRPPHRHIRILPTHRPLRVRAAAKPPRALRASDSCPFWEPVHL